MYLNGINSLNYFSPTKVKLQGKTDTDTTEQINSSLANAQAQLTFADLGFLL